MTGWLNWLIDWLIDCCSMHRNREPRGQPRSPRWRDESSRMDRERRKAGGSSDSAVRIRLRWRCCWRTSWGPDQSMLQLVSFTLSLTPCLPGSRCIFAPDDVSSASLVLLRGTASHPTFELHQNYQLLKTVSRLICFCSHTLYSLIRVAYYLYGAPVVTLRTCYGAL